VLRSVILPSCRRTVYPSGLPCSGPLQPSSWRLSGPGIRAGSLPSNRQPLPVPTSPIASNADQTTNILGHLAPQIAFHTVPGLDDSQHNSQLVRRQIIRSLGRINLRFRHNGLGPGKPYAIDVAEGIFDLLLSGNINTKQSRHSTSPTLASVCDADWSRLHALLPGASRSCTVHTFSLRNF